MFWNRNPTWREHMKASQVPGFAPLAGHRDRISPGPARPSDDLLFTFEDIPVRGHSFSSLPAGESWVGRAWPRPTGQAEKVSSIVRQWQPRPPTQGGVRGEG